MVTPKNRPNGQIKCNLPFSRLENRTQKFMNYKTCVWRKILIQCHLCKRSTPGCRYIQGLQHPHSPTSDLERKVACIKASMDQTSRQSFIPFCLSLQNCWLCPSGLSAPPEEFLLASLARRLPPCLTFAQWEPCPGKQYLIQVGKHNTTVTCRFASFPQYFRVLV